MTNFVIDVSHLNNRKLAELLSGVKDSFIPDEFDEKYKPLVLKLKKGRFRSKGSTVIFGTHSDAVSFVALCFEIIFVRLTDAVVLDGNKVQYASRGFESNEINLVFPLEYNAYVAEFFQEWLDNFGHSRAFRKDLILNSNSEEFTIREAYPASVKISSDAILVSLNFDYHNLPIIEE